MCCYICKKSDENIQSFFGYKICQECIEKLKTHWAYVYKGCGHFDFSKPEASGFKSGCIVTSPLTCSDCI